MTREPADGQIGMRSGPASTWMGIGDATIAIGTILTNTITAAFTSVWIPVTTTVLDSAVDAETAI
jgi:hypothetical protein